MRRRPLFLGIFTLLLLLLVVPLQSVFYAPAVISSSSFTTVYSPEASYISEISARNGDQVNSSDALISLTSPDLVHLIGVAEAKVEEMEWQTERFGVSAQITSRRRVIEEKLAFSRTTLQGLIERRDRLHILSQLDGEVSGIRETLVRGSWVTKDEVLMHIAKMNRLEIRAYVNEEDIAAIQEGDQALFYPDDPSIRAIPVRIITIDLMGLGALNDPFVISTYGGDLPVREADDGNYVPEAAIYKIILEPVESLQNFKWSLVGSVRLKGESRSIISKIIRQIRITLIREFGF